jgi:hypothetical protein
MNFQKASKIVYLAGPYTHESLEVREQRFNAITNAAVFLIGRGYIVFSPVTMTHPIDIVLAGRHNTLGTDFWVTFDEAFMNVCSEMAVLRIDGWEASSGLMRECHFFKERGRPVWYLYPELLNYGMSHSGDKMPVPNF